MKKWNWSTKTTRIVLVSIKILKVNFGNSILHNSKWHEISNSIAKKSLYGTVRLSLKGKKGNCKQPYRLLQVLMHRPNLYLAQNISGRILKKEHTASSGTRKRQPPRHLAKLSIWRGGLDIFEIDPQLNYIIRMYLKVIKSQQCSVE